MAQLIKTERSEDQRSVPFVTVAIPDVVGRVFGVSSKGVYWTGDCLHYQRQGHSHT